MKRHLLTLTMAVLFGSLTSVAQTSTTEVLLETTEGDNNLFISTYTLFLGFSDLVNSIEYTKGLAFTSYSLAKKKSYKSSFINTITIK